MKIKYNYVCDRNNHHIPVFDLVPLAHMAKDLEEVNSMNHMM